MFYKLNCTIDHNKILAYQEENSHLWFYSQGFHMFGFPSQLLEPSPLIELIHRFKAKPVILRVPPWHFYNFHVDTNRYCAINSLLSGYDGGCYFGNSVYKNEKLIDELEQITPLDYQPGRCYMFNTKHRHGIITKAEPRLTFSIGFNYNSYEEMLAYCQQHDL
jgi:hypothetical protein